MPKEKIAGGRSGRHRRATRDDLMRPYLHDPDVTLYAGDCLEVLRTLPSESVDCCTTSPPYWGLRDYGVEGQLGLETTPAEYVERLVDIFREVRRVLVTRGTLWLNLGDSYASGDRQGHGTRVGMKQGTNRASAECQDNVRPPQPVGLKPKDLVGVPWRVAFALQDDGWYLRSEIVWSKPNPMPESVRDRPTKAHEHVFLLAKSASYYFGQDDLREPYRYDGRRVLTREGVDGSHENHRNGKRDRWPGISAAAAAARREVMDAGHDESEPMEIAHAGRNVRDVWEIATQPYPGAHFAVFPEELARRMILGGCPEGGTVLDPFGGSGTAALVARKHGRRAILIELNESYCKLAGERLAQQSLFA